MSLLTKLTVAVQLSLFLVVSACASVPSHSPDVTQDSLAIPTEEEVLEDIWRLNERVVLELAMWIEGDFESAFSLQDFAAAIEFFETTTGIVSHTGTIFGRVPNERTRAVVAKWNTWFEENKHSLVLTPSSCISKVSVAGDDKEPQEMEKQ